MQGIDWIANSGLVNLSIVFFASVALPTLMIRIFLWAFWEPHDLSHNRERSRKTMLLVLSTAILGAVAGISGGMSRVGVVGDVIPAVLVLVGGVSVYLFGIDRSKGIIASLTTTALSLSLVISYALGSNHRGHIEIFADLKQTCFKAMTDPKLLSEEDAFCRFSNMMGRVCMNILADQETRAFPLGNSNLSDQAVQRGKELADKIEILQRSSCK